MVPGRSAPATARARFIEVTDRLPSDERVAIEAVITALYEAISFSGDEGPDFDRLSSLFTPGAHLIEIQASGIDIIDLQTFFDRAMVRLESGRITSFHETQIWHRVTGFGHMAHVLSTYEARDHEVDLVPIARGVNSVQLVKDQAGWRVASLMWQNEDPTNPLPRELLPDPDAQ